MILRVNTRQLTAFQLIYTIFAVQWINTFRNITILPLVADGINILLIILVLRKQETETRVVVRFWNTVTIVLVFEIILGVLQFADNGFLKGPLLLFWSLRMFFRPFLIMLCTEKSITVHDLKKIDSFILPLNFLHLILAAIQFYIFGLRYDWNGGIFGAVQGCNGLVNIFYCVLIAYTVLRYFSKEKKLLEVVIVLVSAMIVAYWSELKFLYIEIIVIVLLAIIINRLSLRTLLLCVGFFVFIGLIVPKMTDFLPDNFNQLYDIEALISYNNSAYNETGRGFISRGNGLDIIRSEINNDSIFRTILGNGLGSANSLSFFNISSQIEITDGWRNYNFFSLTFMVIEMGYLGVIAFLIIFLMLAICYVKIKDNFYKTFGLLLIVITCINIWYNSSWIIDNTAYMLSFFMAIPLIQLKNESKSR